MIRAFYSGREGLRAQQTAMDDISNNIANINTAGFKSKSTEFNDVLYSSMFRPENPGYAGTLQGNGVATASIENNMADGTPTQTDNLLDYCANGKGFFAVQDAAGNTFYTRDGSFSATNGADGMTLKNSQGMYALDSTGKHIGIDKSGNPTSDPGLFTFSNSQGLLNAGGNLFTQSNVDLAQQMADLIITQRGFQMSSSVVQTANQIETMTNDLKG
jgi:flagellar basal-body rod protein FlgG